jgi:glycogen debranching enzyme
MALSRTTQHEYIHYSQKDHFSIFSRDSLFSLLLLVYPIFRNKFPITQNEFDLTL